MTAAIESIDNLLRALHNAVIKAQQLTEEQHLRQLVRYFDDDGFPLTQKIVIPNSTDPDAAPIEFEIPKMALTPPSAIKIRDFEVGFQVRLVGFTDKDRTTEGFMAVPDDPPTHSGPLQVDVGGSESGDGAVANVHVTFEGTDPPEAFQRLLHQLTISAIH